MLTLKFVKLAGLRLSILLAMAMLAVFRSASYAGEVIPYGASGCREEPQCPSPDQSCPPKEDSACSTSPVEYATGVNRLSIPTFSSVHQDNWGYRLHFLNALQMPDGEVRSHDGPTGHNTQVSAAGIIEAKISKTMYYAPAGRFYRYSIGMPGIGSCWFELGVGSPLDEQQEFSGTQNFFGEWWRWEVKYWGPSRVAGITKIWVKLTPLRPGVDLIQAVIGDGTGKFNTKKITRSPYGASSQRSTAPALKIDTLPDEDGFDNEFLQNSTIPEGSQWTEVLDNVTVLRRIKNTATTSGTKRIASTVYSRKVGEEPEEELYKVDLSYYGSGDPRGAVDDLKLITASVKVGGSWVVDAKTFLTWSEGHNVRYVIGPEAYARLERTSSAPDAMTYTDLANFEAQIKSYADYYFEYDSSGRVTKEVTAACGSCGGSSLTGDTFAYTKSTLTGANPEDPNHWWMKTTVTHADGTKDIVFTNGSGNVLLKVHEDTATPTPNRWHSYTRYDAASRPVLRAAAPTATGYDGGVNDLGLGGSSSFLVDNAGLVRTYSYDSNGMLQHEKVQEGESGASVTIESYTYSSNTSNETDPQENITFRPLASVTRFPTAGGSGVTTSFVYEFAGTTNRIKKRTTTLAAVPTAENGENVTSTIVDVMDDSGNREWQKDARGYITYSKWDPVTDKLQTAVADVDTTTVSNEPTGWTTPAGGGLHLSSNFSYDTYGRLIQVLSPAVSNAITSIAATPGGGGVDDVVSTATTVRRAEWIAYVSGATQDERRSASGYETGGSTYTLINPVSVTRMGKDGSLREQFVTTRSSTSGKLQSSDTLVGQSGWHAWTVTEYNDKGLRTAVNVYHLIPSSGSGVSGTNFNKTTFGYDQLGRQARTLGPGGTIARTVYDDQGRVKSTWVGTDDVPSSGSWSPLNPADLVKVSENEYDGNGVGAGNLTKATHYENATDTRVTTYTYDYRNRRETTDGEENAFSKVYYDNLNRVIKSERYDTSVSGTLLARGETSYDNRGRVYESKSYAISPTGTPGNALTSSRWYDAGGNLIKSIEAGAGKTFTKMSYDGLGRATKTYVGYDTAETSYADASTVAGDTIVEQGEMTYDKSGNVINSVSMQRRHDATGTGALAAGADPKARMTYSAAWFDPLGRRVASANYGTNGGSAFSRPSTVPDRSDIVLVALSIYEDHDHPEWSVDPKGIQTKMEHDDADRTTKVIEAYDDGDPTTGAADRDRVTEYSYTADGQVKTLTAKNGSTGDQVTTYVYGTTASEGYPSTTLLRATMYPDSDDTVTGNGTASVTLANGTDATFDRVEMKYNRLGQVIERKDQNETVHAYNYDKLGRLTQDRVTAFGTSIDQAIKRIGRTYTQRGQLEKVTSYDNATVGSGTVKNEVQIAYNDFGQLTHDYQGITTAVNTASTPKTQYGYADGTNNQVRLNTITYPLTARVITYDYGTGSNDVLSRVSAIKDGTTILQAASYLGGANIVKLNSPEPGLELDYTTGTDYDRLDRFGRVLTHKWTTGSGVTTVDEFAYGYDRASNRTFKDHVNATSRDELYAYDTLHRLTARDRGDLNTNKDAITGTATQEEDWTLDALGNWNGYVTKASGTTDLTQTRTHNKANEIAASGIAETVGPAWVDPVHDKAGNMTTMPQATSAAGGNTTAVTATYDAWNRMKTTLLSTGGSVTETYEYDGLGRRTYKNRTSSPEEFYSSGWRLVVENVSGLRQEYVWGSRYIDEVVCQYVNSNIPGQGARTYAVQDANFNVTATISAGGTVQSRIAYTPYGLRTVMNASFGSGGTGFRFGHQGLMHDIGGSGLIYNRARYLHPGLGRFTTRDPISLQMAANAYAENRGNPITNVDPTGLYDRAGHFYTAYMTAVAAGLSPDDAFRLAYFTQLPDNDLRYDAVNAFHGMRNVPAAREWYSDIQNLLHSLHSGNVDKRRECLAEMLKDGQLQPWEKGFVTHAFGDAFAHTYNGILGLGSKVAYKGGVGHGFDGHYPDNIGNRPEIWQDYAFQLFSLYGGNSLSPSQTDLMSILLEAGGNLPYDGTLDASNSVSNNEARIFESLARSKFGYNFDYRPEDGVLPGAGGSGISDDDVAALMRKIKCACKLK